MYLVSIVYTVNIEIIFDNVAAFALEAVSIRASSGRTREAGGERQRGPEEQLLRHSFAMTFPQGREIFCHLCPHLDCKTSGNLLEIQPPHRPSPSC